MTSLSPFAVVEYISEPGRMSGSDCVSTAEQPYSFEFRIEDDELSGERGQLQYWSSGSSRAENGRLKRSKSKSKSRGRTSKKSKDGASKVKSEKRRDTARLDRFRSTAITSIVFLDDPAFEPGRDRRGRDRLGRSGPTADTAIFTGLGRWNGEAGYSFEARATDMGEPGRRLDTMKLTIHDRAGAVVVSFDGVMKSVRIACRSENVCMGGGAPTHR